MTFALCDFNRILINFIIVSSLTKKFKLAADRLPDAKANYVQLSNSLSDDLVTKWKKEEEKAMEKRGEALDIYNVQLEKGMLHVNAIN